MEIIYGLTDPLTNEVRYVGFTTKGAEQRLAEHIEESKVRRTSSHKQKWILKLLSQGFEPKVVVLKTVSLANWQEREKFWIKVFGSRLTNSTEGGTGLINPTQDVRNRISKSVSKTLIGNTRRLNIQHTEANRLAISEGLRNSAKFQQAVERKKGNPLSKAAQDAAVAACKGVAKSEEHKLKISLAMKNSARQKAAAEARAGKKIPKSSEVKMGSKFINNGTIVKQLKAGEALPEGWKFGMKL